MNIQETVLAQLSSGNQNLGQIKDSTSFSYNLLIDALTLLIEEEKVEPSWSNDSLPARVYRLKSPAKLCIDNLETIAKTQAKFFWQ